MPARCVAPMAFPRSVLLFLCGGPQKHLCFLEGSVWSGAKKHLVRAHVREERPSLTRDAAGTVRPPAWLLTSTVWAPGEGDGGVGLDSASLGSLLPAYRTSREGGHHVTESFARPPPE